MNYFNNQDLQKDIDINEVELEGRVVQEPEFSHKAKEESFYKMFVAVKRKSGVEDILPVVIPENLVDYVRQGEIVSLNGKYRSHNVMGEDNKSHLALTIFCRSIRKTFENAAEQGEAEEQNNIHLTGYVTKPVIWRSTPKNREIADIFLAVNRQTDLTDYIPCIAWGKNAKFSKYLQVGDRVELDGRIQSRVYIKKLDGAEVSMTAYEVSISNLALISQSEKRQTVQDDEGISTNGSANAGSGLKNGIIF